MLNFNEFVSTLNHEKAGDRIHVDLAQDTNWREQTLPQAIHCVYNLAPHINARAQ